MTRSKLAGESQGSPRRIGQGRFGRHDRGRSGRSGLAPQYPRPGRTQQPPGERLLLPLNVPSGLLCPFRQDFKGASSA